MAKKKKISVSKQDIIMIGMTAIMGYMAILGVCLFYKFVHG